MTLDAKQLFNVYVGLKQRDIYKKRLESAIMSAKSLNDIIQRRNDSLRNATRKIMDLNSDISEAQDLSAAQAVEIQRLKDKKTPWYRHPVAFAVTGLIAGILIAK